MGLGGTPSVAKLFLEGETGKEAISEEEIGAVSGRSLTATVNLIKYGEGLSGSEGIRAHNSTIKRY